VKKKARCFSGYSPDLFLSVPLSQECEQWQAEFVADLQYALGVCLEMIPE
jgi:hypothetical protein